MARLATAEAVSRRRADSATEGLRVRIQICLRWILNERILPVTAVVQRRKVSGMAKGVRGANQTPASLDQ